jgi:quinoprotein glucose dehydrogenase
VLDNPDCGAVLRCELDGSELEIYATGLRNPQELAFDDHGNLFTGDNNGDGGDRARLVHVVAGGDSGWRIGPQWIDDRGPWNRERLWHLAHRDQPAWIVPPIAHLCNGPSGFTHYPGTGLPDRYADAFFLVDFTGSPAQSGVHSFRLQPSGASFELAHLERFAWGVLATDCEFGPDGGLWLLDWVEGWEGSGKGRIWRVVSPEVQKGGLVAATRDLLKARLAERGVAELQDLLGHRDQRVRMEAHFALADKGPEALLPLAKVAADPDRGLARLHAVWGLMLLARSEPLAGKELLKLLDDPELEIRAQAAKALGERRFAAAADKLRARLSDPNLRVRMLAAEALGRIADRQATDALCKALHENADRDPFLRHAASLALSRCAGPRDAGREDRRRVAAGPHGRAARAAAPEGARARALPLRPRAGARRRGRARDPRPADRRGDAAARRARGSAGTQGPRTRRPRDQRGAADRHAARADGVARARGPQGRARGRARRGAVGRRALREARAPRPRARRRAAAARPRPSRRCARPWPTRSSASPTTAPTRSPRPRSRRAGPWA